MLHPFLKSWVEIFICEIRSYEHSKSYSSLSWSSWSSLSSSWTGQCVKQWSSEAVEQSNSTAAAAFSDLLEPRMQTSEGGRIYHIFVLLFLAIYAFGHHLVKPISLHSASGFGWNCVRIGWAFLGRRSEVFKAWRAEVRIWGPAAARERTGCNYRGVSCTTVSSILLGGQ